VTAGVDGAAQLGVQGLDRVDDPADVHGEGEERNHRQRITGVAAILRDFTARFEEPD
jgi:hypothetical protein